MHLANAVALVVVLEEGEVLATPGHLDGRKVWGGICEIRPRSIDTRCREKRSHAQGSLRARSHTHLAGHLLCLVGWSRVAQRDGPARHRSGQLSKGALPGCTAPCAVKSGTSPCAVKGTIESQLIAGPTRLGHSHCVRPLLQLLLWLLLIRWKVWSLHSGGFVHHARKTCQPCWWLWPPAAGIRRTHAHEGKLHRGRAIECVSQRGGGCCSEGGGCVGPAGHEAEGRG